MLSSEKARAVVQSTQSVEFAKSLGAQDGRAALLANGPTQASTQGLNTSSQNTLQIEEDKSQFTSVNDKKEILEGGEYE